MAKGKIEWGRMLGKLSPYTILKGLRYMKHYGPKEFWIRLHERFEPEEVPYGPWYEEYKVKPEELEKQIDAAKRLEEYYQECLKEIQREMIVTGEESESVKKTYADLVKEYVGSHRRVNERKTAFPEIFRAENT